MAIHWCSMTFCSSKTAGGCPLDTTGFKTTALFGLYFVPATANKIKNVVPTVATKPKMPYATFTTGLKGTFLNLVVGSVSWLFIFDTQFSQSLYFEVAISIKIYDFKLFQ